jgi:hypothetical protein
MVNPKENSPNPCLKMGPQMREILVPAIIIVAFGSGLAACSQTDSTSTDAHPALASPSDLPIPTDSPFAKIKKDMSQDEVFNILGQPNSTNQHITRKSFLTIAYGSEKYGMEAHYKGQGRIIFFPESSNSNRMDVAEIHYDPSETGYAP